MIIYSASKSDFLDDVFDNVIDEKLEAAIAEKLGRNTPRSEIRSWQNSLRYVKDVLQTDDIPCNAGVALEYNVPYTSKRVDVIISGKNDRDMHVAIIIELKQWEEAFPVIGKDAVVSTYLNGGMHEVAHPSYQALSYATVIADFNADIQDKAVSLRPCAYLHNYIPVNDDPILGEMYVDYIRQAPVYTKHDGRELREFIKKFIKRGDDLETIFMIDRGRLRPSKSLQDCLSSMMKGKEEFTLLDTQKVVSETILSEAKKVSEGGGKRTVIVKGGPGTGKSVLAINLLNAIIKDGMSAVYVSKNAAPRNVYNTKLKGSMSRSRIDELFKGSGQFTSCRENTFDVLLCDEAHRLNEKSGLYSNIGENQVMEIIRSAKMSVFFIDEDQQVTLKDIGSESEIRKYAEKYRSEVTTMELDSQFRCAGSDGYLSWLDEVLDIRQTANTDLFGSGYDFRVFDDPNELRSEIESRNSVNNRSRMVAGYCWNWISDRKNDSSVHDVVIPEMDFGMSWNLSSTQTWAIDPGSVKEIGCIHTCQGLEFDYVGVVIGDDLRYENGKIVTDASKRARTDQSLKGLGKLGREEAKTRADRIIKNTYKVLMSRGMKGCYVFCTDRNLSEYLKKRIGKTIR